MKNYADLGGCYPPQPSASADNTLLDLHNSSYHTQPHPIIAKYYCMLVKAVFYYYGNLVSHKPTTVTYFSDFLINTNNRILNNQT